MARVKQFDDGFTSSSAPTGEQSTLVPDWAASTYYLDNQLVIESDILYRANTSHTSGSTFAGDSANWDKIEDSSIYSHIADTSNPHAVTQTQVGLSEVDNTSDTTKNSAEVTLTNKTLGDGTSLNFSTVGISSNSFSKPATTSAIIISGTGPLNTITGGSNGELLLVVNATISDLTIANEAATYGITTGIGADTVLRSGGTVLIAFSSSDNYWKIIGVIELPADMISYDNTTTLLTATDVQAAIDEVFSSLGGLATDFITHDGSKSEHVTSGDVLSTDASQTVTNKDIDGGTASDTSRLTIPSDTKANLDLLTRKAGTVLYGTDTDKVYYDNGSALIDLAGLSDPMTTRGDIIIRNSSNATARLGIGAAGTSLVSDGTDVSWGPIGGAGSFPLGGIVAVHDGGGNVTVAATGTADSNGFQFCDGAALDSGHTLGIGITNVPDLTGGRFLRGTTSGGTAGDTGGASSVTLTTTELPSHTHSINHDHAAVNSDSKYAVFKTGSYGISEGAHTHTINHGHPTVIVGSDTHYHYSGEVHTSTAGAAYGSTTRSTYLYKDGNIASTSANIVYRTTSDSHSHSVTVNDHGGSSGAASWSTGATFNPLSLGTSTWQTAHYHSVNLPSFSGTSGSSGTGSAFSIIPLYVDVKFVMRVK